MTLSGMSTCVSDVHPANVFDPIFCVPEFRMTVVRSLQSVKQSPCNVSTYPGMTMNSRPVPAKQLLPRTVTVGGMVTPVRYLQSVKAASIFVTA